MYLNPFSQETKHYPSSICGCSQKKKQTRLSSTLFRAFFPPMKTSMLLLAYFKKKIFSKSTIYLFFLKKDTGLLDNLQLPKIGSQVKHIPQGATGHPALPLHQAHPDCRKQRLREAPTCEQATQASQHQPLSTFSC